MAHVEPAAEAAAAAGVEVEVAMKYEVDERVGIVAVIDTGHPFNGPGLHHDSPHVVISWQGRWIPGGSAAGRWFVPGPLIRLAHLYCRVINWLDSAMGPHSERTDT
jgi:hypothetical protein